MTVPRFALQFNTLHRKRTTDWKPPSLGCGPGRVWHFLQHPQLQRICSSSFFSPFVRGDSAFPVAICGVASTHNGVSISVVRYVQRPVEILSIQCAKSLDSTSSSKLNDRIKIDDSRHRFSEFQGHLVRMAFISLQSCFSCFLLP